MFSALFALPRTIWLLGLVSFFNDAASELVYPLVPIYLSSVLMAGPKALGLIEGIAEATGSLLKLFSGVMSDRMKSTKHWVVGGYTVAAIARPLLAFTTTWPMVLALRFADRLGKGLRSSPRDALLALTVDKAHRGLAFGLHRAMDNAGAVVGPLLAAWLLAEHIALKNIFLWTSLGGAIAVILALSVKEPKRDANAPVHRFNWSVKALPAPFKRYLAVLALFTLGNASNMFLLLRAKDMGLPEYQVPLLWALVSLTAALFSTPLSALSDKLGRVRLIVGGWIVYSVFYLLLGLNSQPLLVWPLFAFYGLFMAATEGAEKALVADMVSNEVLGTAYGWFNLTAGIMLLPASIIFGWLWQAGNPLAAFGFSSACALLSALLLRVWVRPLPFGVIAGKHEKPH
ncbi:MAG: MFS transporter [Methylobacter sp.]